MTIEQNRLARTPTLRVEDTEVAARATAHQAYFDRNTVVRAVANAAGQGATLDQIDQRATEFLASREAVTLTSDQVWTTQEILDLETASIDLALAGRQAGRAVVDLTSALAARPSLSAEQRRMVDQLTRSGNAADVVVGRAGSGKTFALDAVRAAFENAGYRLVGASL